MSKYLKKIIDTRWNGNHGIGRYAREISSRLEDYCDLRISSRRMAPLDPLYISKYMKQNAANLFYSPGPTSPACGGYKVGLTVHDLMLRDVPGEVSQFKRFYFDTVIKRLCKRADVIFTVSEYSKLQISNWLNRSDIVVCPNGVSSDFLNFKTDQREPNYRYFLYVGNRKKHKNFDGLLKAFSLFANEFDRVGEFKLYVTGYSSIKHERQIDKLRITNRVKFLGSDLSDVDLAGFYSKAIALIIPSFYEGFGMPALEAMSVGTPVIAANSTALPEVLDGAGILVDPYDVVSIADSMSSLVSDSQLLTDLSDRGLKRAKFFTWDRAGKIVNATLADI